MVVLDADSVMSGRTIVRLVQAMQQSPQVGLIQTMPVMVLGHSLFQRILQFVARICGPLSGAGSNFWQLFGGNYWGHNAITRLKPFMEHCDLPDLAENNSARRHILSHDTVEAALMRKAGYQLWLAPTESGSWEEGPPNLLDMLIRDRRWCQGNLQRFWFLFAPGINLSNRLHILFGLMAYLSSLLWLLFLLLSTADVIFKERFAKFSALPGETISLLPVSAPKILLLATLLLLFLPKFFGLIVAFPRAREYGGTIRLVGSVLLETLFSIFLAPVLMLFHTLSSCPQSPDAG